jgi:hypothetical protein
MSFLWILRKDFYNNAVDCLYGPFLLFNPLKKKGKFALPGVQKLPAAVLLQTSPVQITALVHRFSTRMHSGHGGSCTLGLHEESVSDKIAVELSDSLEP